MSKVGGLSANLNTEKFLEAKFEKAFEIASETICANLSLGQAPHAEMWRK